MPQRQRIAARLASYARDQRGNAAVEMALWVFILALPLMSVIDFGLYVFQNMETENAAQMAAQSAWAECGQAKLPAATYCGTGGTYLTTALQRGAESTTLGSQVSATSTEGQYCVNGSGVLVTSGCTPLAYYIVVTATYNYAPMFGAVSVGSLFPSPIVRTTWRRMS